MAANQPQVPHTRLQLPRNATLEGLAHLLGDPHATEPAILDLGGRTLVPGFAQSIGDLHLVRPHVTITNGTLDLGFGVCLMITGEGVTLDQVKILGKGGRGPALVCLECRHTGPSAAAPMHMTRCKIQLPQWSEDEEENYHLPRVGGVHISGSTRAELHDCTVENATQDGFCCIEQGASASLARCNALHCRESGFYALEGAKMHLHQCSASECSMGFQAHVGGVMLVGAGCNAQLISDIAVTCIDASIRITGALEVGEADIGFAVEGPQGTLVIEAPCSATTCHTVGFRVTEGGSLTATQPCSVTDAPIGFQCEHRGSSMVLPAGCSTAKCKTGFRASENGCIRVGSGYTCDQTPTPFSEGSGGRVLVADQPVSSAAPSSQAAASSSSPATTASPSAQASSNASGDELHCAQCRRSLQPGATACGRCRRSGKPRSQWAFYCSQLCQREHWAQHKPVCVVQEAEARAGGQQSEAAETVATGAAVASQQAPPSTQPAPASPSGTSSSAPPSTLSLRPGANLSDLVTLLSDGAATTPALLDLGGASLDVGEGHADTLYQAERFIVKRPHTTITNGTLQLPESGLLVVQGAGILLDRLTIQGDGMMVEDNAGLLMLEAPKGSPPDTSPMRVQDCRILITARDSPLSNGIVVCKRTHAVIEGCSVDRPGMTGIYAQGVGSHVRATACSVSGSVNYAFAAGGRGAVMVVDSCAATTSQYGFGTLGNARLEAVGPCHAQDCAMYGFYAAMGTMVLAAGCSAQRMRAGFVAENKSSMTVGDRCSAEACEGPGFLAAKGGTLACGDACTADRCLAGWLSQDPDSTITVGNGCIVTGVKASGFAADKAGMITLGAGCEVAASNAVGVNASLASVLTAGPGLKLHQCGSAGAQADTGGLVQLGEGAVLTACGQAGFVAKGQGSVVTVGTAPL